MSRARQVALHLVVVAAVGWAVWAERDLRTIRREAVRLLDLLDRRDELE